MRRRTRSAHVSERFIAWRSTSRMVVAPAETHAVTCSETKAPKLFCRRCSRNTKSRPQCLLGIFVSSKQLGPIWNQDYAHGEHELIDRGGPIFFGVATFKHWETKICFGKRTTTCDSCDLAG